MGSHLFLIHCIREMLWKCVQPCSTPRYSPCSLISSEFLYINLPQLFVSSMSMACFGFLPWGGDETLLEPPPAPRSKWDDSTTPAWMQVTWTALGPVAGELTQYGTMDFFSVGQAMSSVGWSFQHGIRSMMEMLMAGIRDLVMTNMKQKQHALSP